VTAFLPNDLLRANRAHVSDFAAGDLPAEPARAFAVLTCMDARLVPEDFLALDLGDAHVLRNAGAVVTEDVLRSLVLSTTLMGTRSVLVIGHTKCALEGRDQAGLADATGVDGVAFHPFADVNGHVQAQVQKLRSASVLTNDIAVHGLIYQVEDGKLRHVA
jgi:carbonic anhydrase